MNLEEIYKGNFRAQAAEVLQTPLLSSRSQKKQFITTVGAPEIIDRELLQRWMSFQYLDLVYVGTNNCIHMGEVGGILPEHPNYAGRILAFGYVSVDKVVRGFASIEGADETTPADLQALEKMLELPLLKRAGITILQGTRNKAHYDFQTVVHPQTLQDMLPFNSSAAWTDLGATVLSPRKLQKEWYVFYTPVNHDIIAHLKQVEDQQGNRTDYILTHASSLIPKDFVAGMHITYDKQDLLLHPVITQDSIPLYTSLMSGQAPSPIPSEIKYLGVSDPLGRFTTIDEHFHPEG